ncbi:MAG: hypothetical protein H6Q00_913 [Holophagaceae bacterium]|nr:hypothetical protein [Holophagaceae bacterium]
MAEIEAGKPGKSFLNGAEWVRADFHLHTQVDKEFTYTGEANYYNSNYIDALEKAGIRLGVITNHNKFDYAEFKALRATAKKKGIGILPGVELSVNDGSNGIHVLIVFSDQWISDGNDYINPFLTVAFEGKIPAHYENENGRSSLSLVETIRTLERQHRDFFLVFAHVEQNSGLWSELDGGRIEDLGKDEFFRSRNLGFQKVRTHDGAGKDKPCRTKVKEWLGDFYPAEVEGSDPKALGQIGEGKMCYLKLGEFSFEAVKFALFDHARRVRLSPPEPCNTAVIHQVAFEGGMLGGTCVPLSPSLNCLIGPRGNGKSAVIECVRFALGIREDADSVYKTGLVDRILEPGGKVLLQARDEHGRAIRVERGRSGRPVVFVEDIPHEVSPESLLKDILYFGQKDLCSRSESFDESFLDKLLADRLEAQPQEEARLVEGVKQAAFQLKETIDVAEKIASLQREKIELEVQLQIFVDKGVDKTLEEMTRFDADCQAVQGWQEELTLLGKQIKGVADWEAADRAFPVLRSKRTEVIRDDISLAKTRSDEAKASAEASLGSLRDAFTILTEATKKLMPIQGEIKAEVIALQQSLNEPKLDLDVFRKKKARLEQLKKQLEDGAQRASTEQSGRELLENAAEQLHAFWKERFLEREREVRMLEHELPEEIRIQTTFKGKRKAFSEFLRATMKGSGLQSSSYEMLLDAFVDGRELYQARGELEKTLKSESATAKVKAALLDQSGEFLTLRVPDTTEIIYQEKPLGEYSLGQRATVILHVLMHLRRHPVILIDQPEDDLDNETLYSHFIRQLLDRKEETQFVFATHNPNIPVLGDAEQTIVCQKDAEQFHFSHGSIDNKRIQRRIVQVMEGGEEAFRRRREIYQLWKSMD